MTLVCFGLSFPVNLRCLNLRPRIPNFIYAECICVIVSQSPFKIMKAKTLVYDDAAIKLILVICNNFSIKK